MQCHQPMANVAFDVSKVLKRTISTTLLTLGVLEDDDSSDSEEVLDSSTEELEAESAELELDGFLKNYSREKHKHIPFFLSSWGMVFVEMRPQSGLPCFYHAFCRT